MLTCTVGLLSGVGTWDGISVHHPHIPRPWNPIRASAVKLTMPPPGVTRGNTSSLHSVVEMPILHRAWGDGAGRGRRSSRMDQLTWKAKIGLVVVSGSTVCEGRYPRVAPRDVGFFTSRMLLRGGGVAALEAMEGNAARAIEELASVPVDTIAYCCTV